MSFRADITPQPDPLQSLGIISMNRFVDQQIRFTTRHPQCIATSDDVL